MFALLTSVWPHTASKRPTAEQVGFAGEMFVEFGQTKGQLMGRVIDETVQGVALWGRPNMDMKSNLNLMFIMGKVRPRSVHYFFGVPNSQNVA